MQQSPLARNGHSLQEAGYWTEWILRVPYSSGDLSHVGFFPTIGKRPLLAASKPDFIIARHVWMLSDPCSVCSSQSLTKQAELTMLSHSIEGKLRLGDVQCLAQGHTNSE